MPTTNPVPSLAPSDMLFNVSTLDSLINGNLLVMPKRLGGTILTWAGLVAQFDAQSGAAVSSFNGSAAALLAGLNAAAAITETAQNRAAAETAAVTAEAAEANAVAAANITTSSVNVKATRAAGRAASTGDGYTFTVYPGGPDGLTRATTYEMRSGVDVPVVSPVNGAEFDAKLGTPSDLAGAAITDMDGFPLGLVYTGGRIRTATVDTDRLQIDAVTSAAVNGVLYVDQDDFGLALLSPDGSLIAGLSDPTARTAAATSLTAAKGARVPNGLVIVWGDSRQEINSAATPLTTALRQSDCGPFVWASYFSGGTLELAYNGGVGGDKSADALARLIVFLASYTGPASIIYINNVINDVIQNIPTADTAANLIAMCALAREHGLLPALGTGVSLGAGSAFLTAAHFTALCDINRWIRDYANSTPHTVYVDCFSPSINPMDANGAVIANYLQTDDLIHQSPYGAKIEGQAIANALAPHVQAVSRLPVSIANRWGLTNGGSQLFDNPFMQGSGGENGDSSKISGVIPAGCRLSVGGAAWPNGSIVGSLVARADGYGNDWQIAAAGSAAGSLLYFGMQDISGRVNSNDVLQFIAAVEVIGAVNLLGLQAMAEMTVNGVPRYASVFEYSEFQPTGVGPNPNTPWTPNLYPQGNYGGVHRIKDFPVPASGTITLVRVVWTARFAAAGSATFKIGRVAVNRH